MGTIFEAEHAMIGNKVAVKLLHEPFAERREPVQRLYREARATGAIGHPNIIKVHDVGETEEGTPYLVMELLEGESLGARIDREGPLPLGFALDAGIQMLSALHAAHEAGIIHRDLKSDNVFLVRTNKPDEVRVKILDFGISKFTEPGQEGLKLTQTGSVLGTPYYMAPEQASGRNTLDHRLDIWAAGVIVYEMLLGMVPHSASNYNALLIEIIARDVEPFRLKRPDVPKTLETAVLKALKRDRETRWQRALDFMEALVEVRDSLPTALLRSSPVFVHPPSRARGDAATTELAEGEVGHSDGTPLAFETGGGLRVQGKPRTVAWLGASAAVLAALLLVAYVLLRGGEKPPPHAADMGSNAAAKPVVNVDPVRKAAPKPLPLKSESSEAASPAETRAAKTSVKRPPVVTGRRKTGAHEPADKKEDPTRRATGGLDQPMDNPF
ncbi:MAG: serine/threonine-protein kinase, partial [Deltaproteobacteria bacterium]|nr:serine/threonine-protein kinase [Deltaproteobacteria bacterium]